ncbi:MAG: ATP-binding cassette domain-containing protein [Bdellovibrionales bacterium]|jgi:ATP-binding cassette subfamily F protein 3|nr:ATP-binding cassette domain-containing protein [Bdellovibrionales bacterium]
MNLLQLQNGTKQFGTKLLFDRAQFAINEGDHVGVIGPNGAGKTTLFKILVGQESLDSGEITKSQKLKVGYLEQESREPLDRSAEEFLTEISLTPIWELKQLGLELGLSERHFRVPFHELSGGYRMRMKLLSLIGRQPNLMLLDEPTNFLDLESVIALEKFLQGYEGAFLLISHDREFLRRTTDHTLEVEQGEITKFPGNIDDYFEQKAQLRTVLEAQAANQETKRKHLQSFIDRFGAKATKARQAQSRAKQLEKMEKIEIKDLPVRARIKIPPPVHTGKESMLLTNATLGYLNQDEGAQKTGLEKSILTGVNLRLERGDHLGVVGFNGAGKSTLLKSLAGRIPLLQGERKLGYQVSLSYYAQHVSEELNPEDTVFESLEKAAHKDILRQDILNIAGSLLFNGDAIEKKIRVLSGGEKSRVALGQILLKRSPLILMDEPTNHLDFDTVEAMTEALKSYEGTVVVVSHDRGFIGRIATKILEIRDGRAEIYPGTYDDYVWSLEKGALKARYAAIQNIQEKASPSATEPKSERTENSNRPKDFTKKYQAEARESQRQITKIEAKIANLTKEQEQTTDALNASLAGSANGDPGRRDEIQTLTATLDRLTKEITQLEDELLAQIEKLEQAESFLTTLPQE